MLFLGKRLLHAGLILLGVTLICYLLLFMLPAIQRAKSPGAVPRRK
ncbi:putative glutathione ABC transporter, permease protein GsiC [Klebsiella pneumoniae]|uniref:Putative glutathione ABC transporter, permease protein GsiC n=1 Tax=Klebsiella pneumoniae TaxID=573 RepID=A0A378CNT5_KLEPN|nr:putative glutathione ABC transporter, permease protein GsiC [Klebsiella pneumoniae]